MINKVKHRHLFDDMPRIYNQDIDLGCHNIRESRTVEINGMYNFLFCECVPNLVDYSEEFFQ